jgi:glycosyltransferase involved in cell wall biosynthesis
MISVVVCTADRAENLDACFDALAGACAATESAWELIVVDNGSVDATRAVIERRAQRGDLPIRYLYEPNPGLSRARNAGIAAARQPIVCFTDDDCRVAPDWLSAIETEFSDPHLSILGGRVTLQDPGDRPISIRPFAEPAPVGDLDEIVRLLIGCNMAVRATTFAAIGTFDVRLGAGTSARSAEDLDFFYRALQHGLTLRYSPSPHVRHAHGRRSPEAEADAARGYTAGRGAFYFKHALRGDRTALRHLYWEARTSLVSLRDRERRESLQCMLSGGFDYILRT